MLPFVKNLLPRLKQYSKSLDQSSIFIDKPWIMIDENLDQHHYVFHKDGRLIMSLNGAVQIGTWEYLAGSNSLLIDRVKDKILLNQEFVQDDLMFLRKDGHGDTFFVLMNKNVIPDLNYEKYLKKCFIDIKGLKSFKSNDQKTFYATPKYVGAPNTNINYYSPFDDQIYDENLEPAQSGTIITKAKSLKVINGEIQSIYYPHDYKTDKNQVLTINQSRYDCLSIGDSVVDTSGNLVHGQFIFKPTIIDNVKYLNVNDGVITEIREDNKTGIAILFSISFVFIIFAIWAISAYNNNNNGSKTTADIPQKPDSIKTDPVANNDTAKKMAVSGIKPGDTLINNIKPPILKLPNDGSSYTIKLTNILTVKREDGSYYVNYPNRDSTYYCMLTFGMKKLEYKLYYTDNDELSTADYQVGDRQFELYKTFASSYEYRYSDETSIYEFSIFELQLYSNSWVEIKVGFSKFDIKKNTVEISGSGTMMYNSESQTYQSHK